MKNPHLAEFDLAFLMGEGRHGSGGWVGNTLSPMMQHIPASWPRSLLLWPHKFSESTTLCRLFAKSCPTLATPRTVACQASLSMGFSRQEYWGGLSFPLQGIFPTQGSNLCLCLVDRFFFTIWLPAKPHNSMSRYILFHRQEPHLKCDGERAHNRAVHN